MRATSCWTWASRKTLRLSKRQCRSLKTWCSARPCRSTSRTLSLQKLQRRFLSTWWAKTRSRSQSASSTSAWSATPNRRSTQSSKTTSPQTKTKRSLSSLRARETPRTSEGFSTPRSLLSTVIWIRTRETKSCTILKGQSLESCWSPPTWLRAASTSTTSTWSSNGRCAIWTPLCIAQAARAEPASLEPI